MRVVVLSCGPHGDIEPTAGRAVRLQALGAPPGCAAGEEDAAPVVAGVLPRGG